MVKGFQILGLAVACIITDNINTQKVDTDSYNLEIEELEKLIKYQEEKLNIIQTLREKLIGSEREADTKDMEKFMIKKLEHLLKEKDEMSASSLKNKNDILNSFKENTVFAYDSKIANLLPLKTRKYRSSPTGVLSPLAYVVQNDTNSNIQNLVDFEGKIHDKYQYDFDLNPVYDDLGLSSIKVNENVLVSSQFTFVTSNFTKSEINVIVKELGKAEIKSAPARGDMSSVYHELKFGTGLEHLKLNSTQTNQENSPNVKSTNIIRPQTRSIEALVSDDQGNFHFFNSEMKNTFKLNVCDGQESVNDIHKVSSETLFYVCDKSIGRLTWDQKKFRTFHTQPNFIGHTNRFDQLIVFVSAKNQQHYFSQTEQGKTDEKQSSVRSLILPFNLVYSDKDLLTIRLKQIGNYLLVIENKLCKVKNTKECNEQSYQKVLKVINFGDYLYKKAELTLTRLRAKDLRMISKHSEERCLKANKFKVHVADIGQKEKLLVIENNNGCVITYSHEKVEDYLDGGSFNEAWFDYIRYGL